MEAFRKAKRMEHVHSDIRGPLYMEALEMQKKGMDILKLNTGNPAVFPSTRMLRRDGEAKGSPWTWSMDKT